MIWCINGPTHTSIVAKLLEYSDILRAILYALLVTFQHTQPPSIDNYNFIDSLTNINSSQHNYLDKLLIATIMFHIQHTKQKVTIQRVRVHVDIMGKNKADKLVKRGSIRDPFPSIYPPSTS